MIIRKKVIPIIDYSVRELCKRPYYNHPKGCPNFGKRPTCPPQAVLWDKIFDIKLATWIFFTRFNLAEHRKKMQYKHPNWSKRQCDCCLYWQPKARKALYDFVSKNIIPGFKIIKVPEAMGINITETMKQIGIKLEWPPETWTYQIALGGWLLS